MLTGTYCKALFTVRAQAELLGLVKHSKEIFSERSTVLNTEIAGDNLFSLIYFGVTLF